MPHSNFELRVGSHPEADLVPLGRAHFAPDRFEATVVGGTPLDGLRLEFAVVDGKPRCVAIHAPPERPLTGDLLRRLRLADYTKQAAMVVSKFVINERNGRVTLRAAWATGESLDRFSDAYPARPRRGVPVPEATLRRVAEIHEQAVGEGRHPVKAVKDGLGASRATATRYVKKARELNLVPPSERSRPSAERRRTQPGR